MRNGFEKVRTLYPPDDRRADSDADGRPDGHALTPHEPEPEGAET
jgi:hypothetical protein